MSYFLPLFLQKRILRYALSRLELLDTDALDLENLDIVWGRKSTIELRDVGIHIKKVSALLKLQPNLIITKAKISILRVTVPADLYQSSIVLEVEGIDISIRTDTSEEGAAFALKKEGLAGSRPKKPSKTVKADRPRSTLPVVHDPGGWPDSDDVAEDEDTQLPNTFDLAQSFVQAEPTEERSELQAAVARSLYLNQSQTLSDDGLDVSELGVGTENYLPAFLAGFLKGVGDRIQVAIKNVKVDLDLCLAVKDDTQPAEDVKIRLVIGSISMGEASQKTAEIHTRRIVIKTINLLIISEPSLYSNLVRSAAPSSPETTQASAVMTAPSKSNDSSPSIANTDLPTDKVERSVTDLEGSRASTFSAQDSASDEVNETQTNSASQLVDDATATEAQHDSSMFSDSFYSSGRHSRIDKEETEKLQPLRDSSVFGMPFDGTASMRVPRKPDASQDLYDIQDSPPAAFSAFPPPTSEDVASLTATPSPNLQKLGAKNLTESLKGSTTPLSKHSTPDSRPSSPSSEDLSESKIFSHEEAESMYMSAMSSNSLHQSESASRICGSGRSSRRFEDKNVSQFKQPGALEDETEPKVPLPSFANQTNVKSQVFNEDCELGRSRTSTLLAADQELEQSCDSKADPASVSGTIATGHNAASSHNSPSPVSSSRDQSVLAKQILLIDFINLELPVGNRETTTQVSGMRGAYGQAEKSFAAKSEYDHTTSSMAAPRHERAQPSNTALSEEPLEPAIDVTVGTLQIVGDVGLTKLTILLVERLTALHNSSMPFKRKPTQPSVSNYSRFIIAVNSVSWKFLDVVKGSFISDSAPLEAVVKDTLPSEGSDVLLKSEILRTHMEYANPKNKTVIKLVVGKFLIGYADNNILSFDAGLKSRDSTRDVSLPMDKDLSLTVIETKNILSIDLTTLPLHIVLDLRRLDETFSWFGGFNSMLGLGSSMMSTITLLDPKVKPLPVDKATRGVHFERPGIDQPPNQASTATKQQQKVTARMGGFVFDLQGTKTALQVESTAIKLVSRTEGVGLQIDRLVLNGPSTGDDNAGLPTIARLSNVRVEYLTTPKENDLTRLLTLLAPSKNTYNDGDDILVDTLIRQRKKGGVLRATVESANVQILDPHALQCFPLLAEEAKKLATVAKYLPEDDRPGLLTLLLIKSLSAEIHANNVFGIMSFDATNTEIAHVTFPTLLALAVNHCNLSRNKIEELVCKALSSTTDAAFPVPPPMIEARFVGNEMEPTVKLKFHNTQLEYHVITVMAFMDLKDDMAAEELVSGMVSSIATLTSRRSVKPSPTKSQSHGSACSSNSFTSWRALGLDVIFRDCVLGLNPRDSQAKALVVLTDTRVTGSMPKGEDANATLEISKAELMIIDDLHNVREHADSYRGKAIDTHSTQVQVLAETGYVSVSQVSAAKVVLHVAQSKSESGPAIDVEIRDDLFVLESCADSTQTVITILNGLKLPMPKSTALKYQTEVVPVEDMLASFSGEAFEMTKADRSDEDEEAFDSEEEDLVEDDVPQNLEYVSSFYNPDPETSVSETMADSVLDGNLHSIARHSISSEIGDKNLLESFQERVQVAPGQSPLDFRDDHFGSGPTVRGAAHDGYRKHNTHLPTGDTIRGSPLRVRVRDVHIIWNLFDGYDWQHTRDAISQAVAQVQHKAVERQAARKRSSFDPEEDDEDVIGDFLFNSIYIGIPAKSDPADLARQVNRNIDDLVSETGSYATSTSGGASPNRAQAPKPNGKRLRLQRSKHHKLTFELKGVCADAVVFPPGSGETESLLDIRVQDLDIFDHVPSSTWKKFATYMHDAGDRESGTSMIHIEILNVKPVPNLAASEIVLKVSIHLLLHFLANPSIGICSTSTFAC